MSPEEYDKLREADERRGSVKRGSWLADKRAKEVKSASVEAPKVEDVTAHDALMDRVG